MFDFIPLNVVIGLELFYGSFIAYFWINFFSTLKDKDFSHMPEGYLLHEKSFVWPDAIIVVLLFASAALLWIGNPLGERLSLVAGGMMLFLGVIDIAYEYANDMYKAPRASMGDFMGTISLAVVALTIINQFI
ncbi:hypothetical protein R50073_42720 [Maricurvus nonylphenolicus]|uniref:hypothetical protein n=1 Tax=Maricurvus nonylphenolicus TaxID=1008307 RepID=UPI0036F3DBBB